MIFNIQVEHVQVELLQRQIVVLAERGPDGLREFQQILAALHLIINPLFDVDHNVLDVFRPQLGVLAAAVRVGELHY